MTAQSQPTLFLTSALREMAARVLGCTPADVTDGQLLAFAGRPVSDYMPGIRAAAEQDRLFLERVEGGRQARVNAVRERSQQRAGWMLAQCQTNERNRSAD